MSDKNKVPNGLGIDRKLALINTMIQEREDLHGSRWTLDRHSLTSRSQAVHDLFAPLVEVVMTILVRKPGTTDRLTPR